MCSVFLKSMENYQGDLSDIIRGGVSVTISSGSSAATATREAEEAAAAAGMAADWQFPGNPANYSSGVEERLDDFGDPFSDMQDPLLNDKDDMHMKSQVFLTSSTTPSNSSNNVPVNTTAAPVGGGNNTNIFSRMLQISPTAKLPVPPRDTAVVGVVSSLSNSVTMSSVSSSTDHLISNSNSKGCLVDNAGLQISSPRITGHKRRKSQAKKVVCIPAPAPANSRSSGEIVPSDLWAWRKYGQKPIKGSPYPRGYYRCSSSKGCSARKQVERSRTDPNMLVITYTSEHNHPWPTQRNALAGSTRSQPPKNNSSAPKSSSSSTHRLLENQNDTILKEEQKESNTNNDVSNSLMDQAVNEEAENFRKKIEMKDFEQFSGGAVAQSYKPALPESNHSEDFFADLAEIEGDPLNLLFTQGFCGDEGGGGNKALDPFSFYDWPENSNIGNSHTPTPKH